MEIHNAKVLNQNPDVTRYVVDHPKEVDNPKMMHDLLWFFGEKGKDGLDVEIHPNLKYNGDDDWNDDDEWQWFVNIHRMSWDNNSEEHIEDQGDMVSKSHRSFEEAVQFANKKARKICVNDSGLKYLL